MHRTTSTLLLMATALSAETQTVLYSEQPRPLWDLIQQLERRYGWRITYEEAEVRNLSDLEDLSERYRKMGFKPTGPYYVPKSNPVSVKIKEPVARSKMKDVSPVTDTIKEVIKAYHKAKHPFFFTVTGNGDFFHVIPSAHRDERGMLVAFQPILSTPVTFPPGRRTVYDTVRLVMDQIQQRRGVRIVEGNIPYNLFRQIEVVTEATNTPARRVLIEAFEMLNIPLFMQGLSMVRVSWTLNYSADQRAYYFNAHVLPQIKDP